MGDLHYTLQIVMGWTNGHLHQFEFGKRRYGTPDPNDQYEIQMIDEDEVQLADLKLRVKQKIRYEYDFGDGWLHDVVLEKVAPPDRNTRYPICLAGEMACPPEDCGGLGGFYNMLASLDNPRNKEHKMYIEWLGDDFDRESFDVEGVNEELNNIQQWRAMEEE